MVVSSRRLCWFAAAPVLVTLLSATPGLAGDPVPSFLSKARAPDLVAARAAIDTASSTATLEAAEQKREADARLLSASDDLARRAEEERVLAAEIRAKAEALSQRFAEELSHDASAAEHKQKAGKDTAKGNTMALGAGLSAKIASSDAAVSRAAGQDERTAEAMQRAADALARARSTLDEADRRVADAKGGPVGTWEKVKAEFTDARRKAAEAVETAQQALGAVPSTVADITTGSLPETKDGAKADPRKTLPRPYALGGTLR